MELVINPRTAHAKCCMVFEKAAKQDIEQLTKLRITYLTEDYGNLNEKELEILKRDLPAYFDKNLNKNIFAYIGRDSCVCIVTCG